MTARNGQPHQIDGHVADMPGARLDADEDGAADLAAADLAAWGREEIDLDFVEVQRAMDAWAFARVKALARRVTSIETPDEALRFLVDEGIVGEDEARTDI